MRAALAFVVPFVALALAPDCDSAEPGACARKGSAMLQRKTAQLRKKCEPCEVDEKIGGVRLQMVIFSSEGTDGLPLVLGFHGSGGHKRAWRDPSICREKFYASGIGSCASVRNAYYGKEGEMQITEAALTYLYDNRDQYLINPFKIVLYGYDRGGLHLGKFITSSQHDLRDHLLGAIIDSGTPANCWRDLEKTGKLVPPVLMLHCDIDARVKPRNTINPGIKNIEKVNKKRKKNGTPLVMYHYMKYTKESKCSHAARGKYPSGIDAMKAYVEQQLEFYNGAASDPFRGIPETVSKPEEKW